MGHVSIIATTNKLTRNFRKSRDEILIEREQKFRALLKHAYHNSEFYHDYYESHGISEEDLEEIAIDKLPSIDKKIFVDNFDRLVTDKRITRENIEQFLRQETSKERKYLDEFTVVHSSGTTGKPTRFIYDRIAWETILAAGLRAGKGEVRLRDAFPKILRGLKVLYVAATEGRFGGVMAASSGIKSFGFRPLLLNINLPLELWVDKINRFNPDVIIGYPSAIEILCELIADSKIKVNVFRVITAAEPLPWEQRKYFQSVFNTDIFNIYGASESIIIGLESNTYRGFYIFDDINYVEVEAEHTLITPLYNYTQPLIRYELTDKLMSAERSANEALPFSRIGEVMGRNEEIMWFVNEKGERDFLHPLIINVLSVDDIIRYQFVQYSEKMFDVRVELRKNSDFNSAQNKLRQQMDHVLRGKNLSNLKYQIKQVDAIPFNASTGKINMVIKDSNSKLQNAFINFKDN